MDAPPQDDQQIQTTHATILPHKFWELIRNTLLIVQLKIPMLIKWSCRTPPQIHVDCWTLKWLAYSWTCSPSLFSAHNMQCRFLLDPHLTTYHSNVGVCIPHRCCVRFRHVPPRTWRRRSLASTIRQVYTWCLEWHHKSRWKGTSGLGHSFVPAIGAATRRWVPTADQ